LLRNRDSLLPDHDPSPFQGSTLPPFLGERRNQIYGYVFGQMYIELLTDKSLRCEATAHIYLLGAYGSLGGFKQSQRTNAVHDNESSPPFLSLLQVCCQIHGEAHTLPFALSTFEYQSEAAFKAWIWTNSAQLAMINTIRLATINANDRTTRSSIDGFIRDLKWFRGLKRVEVIVSDRLERAPTSLDI
jgi:hypothetical protein